MQVTIQPKSAATFDLCTALVPSAAAPATFDIDLVTAKPWQPGHPEQLGLPQKAETVATSAANTHSFIFDVCCAVDLLLLKTTKCVPSRASCAVASPP